MLQAELGAICPEWNGFARGVAGMLALQYNAALRKALFDRTGQFECTAGSQFGIGACGVDLKKHKWRSRGRPIAVLRSGFSADSGTGGWCRQQLDAIIAMSSHGRLANTRCVILDEHF